MKHKLKYGMKMKVFFVVSKLNRYFEFDRRFQNRRMKWKRNKKLPTENSEESSTSMTIKEEPSDTVDSSSSSVTMSPT